MQTPNGRRTIGLMLASLHTGASRALFPGLLDAAEKHDVNLICFPGGRLRATEAFENQRNVIYDLVGPESLNGLLTWSSSLGGVVGAQEINRFHQHFQPLPMVSLSYMMDGTPTVSFDGYQGMRALLNHLIEVHHYRRLAFLRGPEKHFLAQERYHAYLDTLEAHQLPFAPELVTPPRNWEAGGEAVQVLLDERGLKPGEDFQAVVAASDWMALDALKILQKRGFHIPDDVAITGFNNSIEEQMANPPLTTVALPFDEQGSKAMEMLVAHCSGESVPALITLPSQLIVRQSCGCPSATVVQAAHLSEDAVPGNASKDTLLPDQAAFALARAACIQEMERLTHVDTAKSEVWIAPIFDAFWNDVKQIRQNAPASQFLALLEKILDQAMRTDHKIAQWHGAISTLRQCALPAVATHFHAPVEALISQGRVVISEAIQRSHAYRQWQAEQDNETLRATILALLTAINLQQVSDVLAEYLPKLGIPSAYLALYENPDISLEYARLILAYRDQQPMEKKVTGQRFPSRQIVPIELLPQQRRYDLVVEPLFFQEKALGFIVLEIGPRQGEVYELLRANLSSALQSALLFDEIEQARVTAEKADQIKTRLLTNVSHELRAPLNIILGYTQNRLQKPETNLHETAPALLKEMRHIQDNAEHLLRVINDLLDISRAEIDELDLSLEMLDPCPLLADAFQNMADQNRRPEVNWRLELPPRLPLIHADALRLRQIFLNLLSNAMKFTQSGQVRLGAAVEPSCLHIWVSDTGTGIAADLQEHIFEPFVTQRNTHADFGGIGLGLSITHHLVMLHGGSMQVESQLGQGSTFHVFIPLPTLKPSSPASHVDSSGVLLLISHTAEPAAEILELSQRQGMKIQALHSQLDIEAVLAEAQPMVLAWDLTNAHPNDWALIRRLRHYPGLFQAPFILYGQTPPTDEASPPALALGLTGFLPKPFDSQPSNGQSLLDMLNAIRPAETNQPILIVDDDPQVLTAHQSLVQNGMPGYPICTAKSGEEALKIMANETPALVMLDLVMPVLGGFDVLDQMRSNERLRQVPVIILSNKILNLDDLKRLEAHAQVVYQNKGLWSDTETIAALNRALFGEDTLPAHTSALVKHAIAYLNDHYARPLSRWEIAEAIGVSEDYISRVFSRELGITAWDYLNRYRVLQARQLLIHSHDSIGSIARQTGFKDQAYFSRVFHKLNGISPQAFREEYN